MLRQLPKNCAWLRGYRALHSLPLTVNKLLKFEREPRSDVELNGWVQSVKKQKQQTFITITDGSCPQTVQAVVTEATLPAGSVGLALLNSHTDEHSD
jgi:aspartyl/asparaginyl-tRNA synthetase